MRIGWRLAPFFVVVVLTGCVFSRLNDDLNRLEDETHLFTGDITSELLEFHSTVVVSMADPAAEDIISFRMLAGGGEFEIRQPRKPAWFFAFADLNNDLRFQPGEPHGWAAGGNAVVPGKRATRDVDIFISQRNQATYPTRLVEEPLERHLKNYARAHIGSVSTLDDPLFSSQQGNKGLWQPYAFWEDGGTGLHFLEPFDPNRVPLLFVHGINGSPQDFLTMISQVDTSRYQVWFVSYPSGMRLSWLSRGVFQFMEALSRQYDIAEMHVIAHSGGGLVSRGALNLCAQNSACGYIRSFTAISTPWNGVTSAKSGVKWAPSVIPVWRDLTPDSEFVSSLFDTPLPDGMPFNLLFGFRKDGFIVAGSSDGVIELSSQLRSEAQQQADWMRGFDRGHVSILHDDTAIGSVFDLIETAGP